MPQDNSITQVKRPLDTREAGINENWLTVLDAYRVRFLVLNLHSEGDMVKFFRSQPGWSVDFEDGETVIFARAEAPEIQDIPTQAQDGLRIAT